MDNPGRCGPLFGGKRCNKNLGDERWIYCNTANGWCGNTDAHKNWQEGDEYDWESSLCRGNIDILLITMVSSRLIKVYISVTTLGDVKIFYNFYV